MQVIGLTIELSLQHFSRSRQLYSEFGLLPLGFFQAPRQLLQRIVIQEEFPGIVYPSLQGWNGGRKFLRGNMKKGLTASRTVIVAAPVAVGRE